MQATFNTSLKVILDAVVTSYIGRGVPVGSRYVWVNFDVGLSPASIRSQMAALEDMGFLMKPHVSAGRIPTETGYRAYVDRLMKRKPLSQRETSVIRKAMDPALPVSDVLEGVSRSLEALSHQICVVLAPGRVAGVVTSLESVRTSSHTLLVKVTIEPGTERMVSVDLGSRAGLEAASRYLKRVGRAIVGCDVKRAGLALKNTPLSTKAIGSNLARLRSSLIRLIGDRQLTVHVHGTGNIVPELGNTADARSLLDVLERKQEIAGVLMSHNLRSGTSVSIGSENQCKPMRLCSVVTSPYWIGEAKGAVGVIGPLRMQYPRLVALVEYASQELTRFLAEAGGSDKRARQRA